MSSERDEEGSDDRLREKGVIILVRYYCRRRISSLDSLVVSLKFCRNFIQIVQNFEKPTLGLAPPLSWQPAVLVGRILIILSFDSEASIPLRSNLQTILGPQASSIQRGFLVTTSGFQPSVSLGRLWKR